MSLWEQWRPWMVRHHALLRDLAIMLISTLVVGVYFLEHFSLRLENENRVQLSALAEQTARRVAEPLASGNVVSLTLIGGETAALPPVRGVRFDDTAGQRVEAEGVLESALKVVVPVALPDGEQAGTLTLYGDDRLLARQQLEAGFVLVVLCLLLLRVVVALVQQRLQPTKVIAAEEGKPEPTTPTLTPSQEATPRSAAPVVLPDTPPLAQLRLSVVNLEHIRQRYTPSALQAVLDEYQQWLTNIADIYGGKLGEPLGREAGMYFYQSPVSQSGFSALCAGLLFLRVVRLAAPERKKRGVLSMEFKALVTTEGDQDETWALCQAGVPGRVHVPEPVLAQCELDVKALYQPEKSIIACSGEQRITLQPVEQLAHRYQSLLRTQAQALLDAMPHRALQVNENGREE